MEDRHCGLGVGAEMGELGQAQLHQRRVVARGEADGDVFAQGVAVLVGDVAAQGDGVGGVGAHEPVDAKFVAPRREVAIDRRRGQPRRDGDVLEHGGGTDDAAELHHDAVFGRDAGCAVYGARAFHLRQGDGAEFLVELLTQIALLAGGQCIGGYVDLVSFAESKLLRWREDEAVAHFAPGKDTVYGRTVADGRTVGLSFGDGAQLEGGFSA